MSRLLMGDQCGTQEDCSGVLKKDVCSKKIWRSKHKELSTVEYSSCKKITLTTSWKKRYPLG